MQVDPSLDVPESGPKEVPKFKFYSPQQVVGATFLAGPWVGLILMGLNYDNMGLRRQSTRYYVLAGLSIPVVCGIAWFLPSGMGLFFPVGYTVLMHNFATDEQTNLFDCHELAGGRKASTWGVVGLSLLSLFFFVALLFGAVLSTQTRDMPHKPATTARQQPHKTR